MMLGGDDHLRKLMKQGHSFHEAVQIMCAGSDDTPIIILRKRLEPTELTENPNILITKDELDLIRRLSDFDLTMFLSDINEHTWQEARITLWLIHERPEYQNPQRALKKGRA